MPEPTTILFATSNRGKLREARAILNDPAIRFISLDEFPDYPEPVEDADTFEGNAKIKALYYAKLTNCFTLADDSGLEVDALHGAPGVKSARYAGDACNDQANNRLMIQSLGGVDFELRTARFRCVIAWANPEKVLATASGVVEGLIVDNAQGENGFGYDPHFFVPEYGMTTAQMPPDQKNSISHRGQALRRMRTTMDQYFSPST